jgi:hypothetical protein
VKWYERSLAVILSLIALVVAVVDLLGLSLTIKGVVFSVEKSATAIMLLIVAAALPLLLSTSARRRREMERVESEIAALPETLIDGLSGERVHRTRIHANVDEHYRDLEKRVGRAKTRIDALSLNPFHEGHSPSRQYYAALKTAVGGAPGIKYRRIAILARHSDATVGMLKDELSVLGSHAGYYLGIYDLRDSDKHLPFMNVLIIDNKTLFLGLFRHYDTEGAGDIALETNSPEMIKIFSEYLDWVWLQSTKLKDGDVDASAVARLDKG